MTIYVDSQDNQKEIPATTALWQTGADSIALPTQLSAAKFADQEPATILQTIAQTFMSDQTAAEIAKTVETALAQTFKKKKLATLVDLNDDLAFGETFHGATMTQADLAVLLLSAFSEPNQIFASADPDLIVALAANLLPTQKLVGIYDPTEVGQFVQDELASIQADENIQIATSPAPEAAIAELHAATTNVQLVSADQLLTLIPQTAVLFNLTAQNTAPTPLEFVIGQEQLPLVLAAAYAQKLGLNIDHVTVAVDVNSTLAKFLGGDDAQLTPSDKTILIRLISVLTDSTKIASQPNDLRAILTDNQLISLTMTGAQQIQPTIKHYQIADNYTIGASTALAAAGIAQKKSNHKIIVIAPVDPYLTPEIVLQSITGRDDGKRDFESVQILRQIINTKTPRLLTHLKASESATIPEYQLANITAWLA